MSLLFNCTHILSSYLCILKSLFKCLILTSLVMFQKDFIKLNNCHDHEIHNCKDILFILALGKTRGKNTIGAILIILHGRLICKQHYKKHPIIALTLSNKAREQSSANQSELTISIQNKNLNRLAQNANHGTVIKERRLVQLVMRRYNSNDPSRNLYARNPSCKYASRPPICTV